LHKLIYNMTFSVKILFLCFFLPVVTLSAQQDTSSFANDIHYQRLKKLPLSLPLFYNQGVKQEIQSLIKNPGLTSQLIAKGKYILKEWGPLFDSANIPRELALLSLVNSGFNPSYVDKDNGASGIWPLTYSTAKRYRLITNALIDQRRNPLLSTHAFIQYIKDLEQIYQDWHFSISAFYAGPINLNMAIRKAGNRLEYPHVHASLDAHQQGSLEKLFAYVYFLNYSQEHQIPIGKFALPASDTVCTQISLTLEYISNKLQVNKATIVQMNQDFLEGIVPIIPYCNCFHIPSDKLDFYRSRRDSIELTDTAASDTILTAPGEKPIELITTGTVNKKPAGSGEPVLIYYTVKSGDNLGLLARLYHCSMNDIKKWNGMKNDMLYAGKKISIYVPGNKVEEYKKINQMTMSQKQARARR